MNDTVEIYLPRQSKPVLLDCQDFCDVWQRKRWRAHQGYLETGYQKRDVNSRRELGNSILQASPPFVVDHINRNPFDNRRSNLRICTQLQNIYNRSKRRGPHSSKFTGVYLRNGYPKWIAQLRVGGKHYHLGSFLTEREAAQAYNEAAVRHFGEFARLNVIPAIDIAPSAT